LILCIYFAATKLVLGPTTILSALENRLRASLVWHTIVNKSTRWAEKYRTRIQYYNCPVH